MQFTVVIARLPRNSADAPVRATLKYKDAITGKRVELQKDTFEIAKIDDFVSINRNYAIALVANSIRAAAEASMEELEAAVYAVQEGLVVGAPP